MNTLDTFEADLAGFAHDWIMRDQARSTLKEYERQLRRYRAATGAQSVSLRDSRAFLLQEAQRSPSSAKLGHRALRAFSKWCANEYDEPDVLLKLVKPREAAPTRTPTATPDDVEKLLKVCDGARWRDRRDHALICVLASTGLRRSEVARIRLNDLDLSTGILLVPITKTRKTRIVRLDSRAVRSVRKYLRVRPECAECTLGVEQGTSPRT
jgi:integrase